MKATLRTFWEPRDATNDELRSRFEPAESVEFDVPDGEIVVAVDRAATGWMVTTIRYVTGEE